MTDTETVRTAADLDDLDGRPAEVVGEYREVPRPVRGMDPGPPEYAVVVLDDGTEVFLGVFATPAAERSETERRRFHGRRVRVAGTVHRRMPNVGQGPLDPCVTDVERIEAVD